MSAGWVAASVRARALAEHRTDPAALDRARHASTLADAVAALERTQYHGDVRADGLDRAQHHVAATLLWHLRVLAGWLPPRGVAQLRALAGWFEIANVDEVLERILGRREGPLFQLGTLATTAGRWDDIAGLTELRGALRRSEWGDPGEDEPAAVRIVVRARWAVRVAAVVPEALPWARAGLALLAVRAGVVSGCALPANAAAAFRRLLPAALEQDGADLAAFIAALPDDTRWVFTDSADAADAAADLWRAEPTWWNRLERDSRALLLVSREGPAPVLGAVAAIAADAWRVRSALGEAATGRVGDEVFGALA